MTLADVPWEMIEKIALAAALGGLIGIERAEANTPAGLRTNMIIAVSTCVFSIMAIKMMQYGNDPVMLAHIISGVGFLGAGTIFHQQSQTTGLTTAATIWLVAGLGMAIGAGEYMLAGFATITALFILHILEPLSKWLNRKGIERKNGHAK